MNPIVRSPGQRGRVLLADGDAVVLRTTSLVLRKVGFTTDTVPTAADAAKALSTGTYDVLIADIDMPGNRRLELLRRGEAQSVVPAILITRHRSFETAVEGLRAGAVDYFLKPVDSDALIARVDAVVRKERASRAMNDACRRTAELIREASEALQVTATPAGHWVSPERAGDAGSVSSSLLERLPPKELDSLSPRERDVVHLLAMGKPIREVAPALGLATNTVRNHMKSVFTKLRVHSQVALLGKLAGHATSEPRKR